MFWYLRRELRTAQDQIADNFAAGCLAILAVVAGTLRLEHARAATPTPDEPAAAGTSPDATSEVLVEVATEPMTELRVILTSPEGEPVVGASVLPYAVRTNEVQDMLDYWDWDSKYYLSDDQGVAIIRYPTKIPRGSKRLTPSQVSFRILHSDYVREVVHFDLGPDPDNPAPESEVQLKKGCESQVSAVDEHGIDISQFGVLMAGRYATQIWATGENGVRRSSAINEGTWQTMLVLPQDDGPTLFSGLMPIRVRPSQAVKLRNVRLSPGTIVHGQLDENVPRPVRNGRVITTTAPKPDGNSWDQESASLIWHETVAIAEDGTFILPSIPRSGKIQVIATCDGFVSQTTPPDIVRIVAGQLFDIDGAELAVTISMEPTASVELTILKPDGTPLDSGTVSSSPSMRYFKGGSTWLGSEANSIGLVRNQLLPPDERKASYRAIDYPFLDCPVVDGKVTIRGIPVDVLGGGSVVLSHAEYEFSAPVTFQLNPPEPTQLTVTVVPHSKAVAEERLDRDDEAN